MKELIRLTSGNPIESLFRLTERSSLGTYMFEILNILARDIDNIIILGEPNIRFILRLDIDNNIVIGYKSGTRECKILVPINAKEYLEKHIPKECTIVAYSYTISPDYDYIIGKTFSDILIGFLKSFVKPSEKIGIPIRYSDTYTVLALSKYWNIKDLSKELRLLRSRKNNRDITLLRELHSMVKGIITEVSKEDINTIAEKCFERLINIVNGVYIEILHTLKSFISMYLYIKKDIYRISYKWSIPLNKEANDLVHNVDNGINKVAKDIGIKPYCRNLVKTIKSYISFSEPLDIEICGIGTEECEYPSISECVYNDIILENGMALKVEISLGKKIFLPKLLIFKDDLVEVY